MSNYFSAADLVKKSASQIKYLRDKMISIHTWRMDHGIQFQKQIAEQKEESAEEFRTSLEDPNPESDIVVFATHDVVCPDKIIEVKTTEFGAEQWYLESSLLQTAFYKSLIMTSNGDMFTPKFRIKEGYKKEYRKVDTSIPYHLQFGDDEYDVEVKDPYEIISYFLYKAKISLGSYDECRAYDAVHKFKHFEDLKHCFDYKKIK